MNTLVIDAPRSADARAAKVIEYKFAHLLQPGSVSAPLATEKALTYGWDTVFAIRMPDVNTAIVKAGCSPKSFVQQAPDGSCTASGTFGPWQISGGDGVDLHFSIPIETGNLVYKGNTYAMDGAVVTIEVQLDFIPPQTEFQAGQAASRHDLMLRTQATADQPIVSVLSLTIPAHPGFIQQALMSGILQVWFNNHLAAFTQVFSSANINRIADQQQFQWLAPTHTRYAFAQGKTPDSSIFAVLCMTQGRDSGGIASQLSPNAIPPSARSGFLISQQRFLEQMILPGLPHAFPGSSASDFALSADKTRIVNNANIKTKPVMYAGITYYPEITALSISVTGEELIVATVTRTDITLGTYAETSVTSFLRLKLATKPDGGQTLIYEESRPAIKDHVTKTTATGEALKIILDIAAAVVAVVLTVLTDGAFLIVALIIVALLVGLVEAVPTLIANAVGNKVSNDSPSLALLVSNATDPIRWPNGAQFALTGIGLNESLQLGGNPGFV